MHGAVQARSFQSTPMQQHRQVKQQSMQTLSAAATQVFANSPCRQESVTIATGPCPTSRGNYPNPHRTNVRSPQPQQLQQRARGAAMSPGVLTPNVGGFMSPCSVVLPARRPSGLHGAHSTRGRSWDSPQARTPMMQIYPPVIRSRSGTPTPRREYSQGYMLHKHGTTLQSNLTTLPTPVRMRTGVAPIMPAMPTSSNSQTTIQTTSALAVSAKDKGVSAAPSLCSTLNRIPQASTKATERSVQSSGAATDQLQQAGSATAPVTSSPVEPPQDLVRTIQLSAAALQERAFPRPSLEDQDAERLLLEQSYQDACRDLERSRHEKQELKAKLQQVQAESAAEAHSRTRVEQEIAAKASECEKRVQAGRKLENENNALQKDDPNIKAVLKAKCDELQNLSEQLQSSNEELNGNNELVECLQDQVKELSNQRAKVECKDSSEFQRQLLQEQEANHHIRLEGEIQRRQIEELKRFVADKERPAAAAPHPPTAQENERLQRGYEEMLAELDNALRQLKSITL